MSVWACRDNGYGQLGQLGLGNYQNRNIFTQIPKIKSKQISTGEDYTAVVDSENNIWMCGHNEFRQLGLSHNENRNILTQISNLKAKEISTTGDYTAIIDLEDNIWIWGTTGANVPKRTIKFKAKQVSAGGSEILFIDLNDDDHNPRKILGVKAKQVSMSGCHQALIDWSVKTDREEFHSSDDNIWVWGNNTCGQLGLGDVYERVQITQMPDLKAKQIATGLFYTMPGN